MASARCRRVSDSARRPLPASMAARICSCSSASRPHALGRLALALVDHLADPRHPQALHELEQVVVARGLYQGDVELPVGLEAAPHVGDARGAGRPAPRASGPAAPTAGRRRPAGRRRARSPAGPRRRSACRRGRCRRRARPRLVAHLHQTLGGQPAQRLPHRRPRDAEVLGQVLLMDAGAALQRPWMIRSRMAA